MSFKKKLIYSIAGVIILALIISAFLSNLSLRVLFEDKIWAHRVNKMEKMQASCGKYSGVELDVVFIEEGGYFDVSHPPDPRSGLYLKDYLIKFCNRDMQIWLDFKNLNESNEFTSLNRLKSIVKEDNLNPLNIIVESMRPEYLQAFSNEGFYTSYYLPINLHMLKEQELRNKLEEIALRLRKYYPDYISTDYKDYPIIKEHFPQQEKLLWFTVYGSLNKFSARLLLYEILMDEKVDVLLLPFSHKDEGIR